MPAWGNGDGPAGEGVQYDNDVIDGGEHQLTVGGQTTCNGGLEVDGDAEVIGELTAGNVNCQGGMQVGAPITVGNNLTLQDLEDAGAVNTIGLGAELELNTQGEGADVIVSHPDDAANPQANLVVQCPRI